MLLECIYLTKNKSAKHMYCLFLILNLQKDETLCYNKKAQSLLRLLGGMRQGACNGLKNVKYYFQAFVL